jgi:hypothetical protein
MKEKLTLEQVKGMTWRQVFDYYMPDAEPHMADVILWNETCYPFDTQKTLDQLYEYYLKTVKI